MGTALIQWSLGRWGLSAAQLELAASRVTEVALEWLLNSGRRLQFAHVRPAVARGYLRVQAAQAVRRSLAQGGLGLSVNDLVAVERLALARLTDRLMSRPRQTTDRHTRLAA